MRQNTADRALSLWCPSAQIGASLLFARRSS